MNRNLIILACALAWLNSCHRQCAPTYFKSVAAYIDSADTAAEVVRYDQGNNFLKAIDSASVKVTHCAESAKGIAGCFEYDFSDAAREYLIRYLPSGRTHMITHITYGNESDHSGCGGGHRTVCSCGYAVDGIFFSQPTTDEDGNKAPDAVIRIE